MMMTHASSSVIVGRVSSSYAINNFLNVVTLRKRVHIIIDCIFQCLWDVRESVCMDDRKFRAILLISSNVIVSPLFMCVFFLLDLVVERERGCDERQEKYVEMMKGKKSWMKPFERFCDFVILREREREKLKILTYEISNSNFLHPFLSSSDIFFH